MMNGNNVSEGVRRLEEEVDGNVRTVPLGKLCSSYRGHVLEGTFSIGRIGYQAHLLADAFRTGHMCIRASLLQGSGMVRNGQHV